MNDDEFVANSIPSDLPLISSVRPRQSLLEPMASHSINSAQINVNLDQNLNSSGLEPRESDLISQTRQHDGASENRNVKKMKPHESRNILSQSSFLLSPKLTTSFRDVFSPRATEKVTPMIPPPTGYYDIDHALQNLNLDTKRSLV